MKVLRFGISDDAHGDLPHAARSWHLAARRLEEATGEQWHTVMRRSWPARSFSRDVEEAIEEEEPDMVMMMCAAFWVSYPSTPLRIHRSGIAGSRQIARFGFWAASRPALAHRRLFHLGRRMLATSATAEFHFDPDWALQRVEEALRAVLRHEEIAVAVRGPLPLSIQGPAAMRALCERRRAQFNDGLERLCRTLHVEYASFGPDDRHPADELAGDRIHVNARGHARRAEVEFDVMLRAWRRHAGLSGDHQDASEG
jgi:hypothetical protein